MSKSKVKSSKKTKIAKKPKVKLSTAEIKRRRDERIYKNNINTVFKNAGFTQLVTRDKEFEFKNQSTEFDAIFVYENILVISEDTCSQESEKINAHLRKKGIIYKHLKDNQEEFIDFLPSIFPSFKDWRENNSKYEAVHFKMIFIYCSRFDFDETYKSYFTDTIRFFDYPYLRYFLKIAKTIHASSKYELFKFLGLSLSDIGLNSGSQFSVLPGFLLPESPSGFESEYKIVTFYIDPKSLLELSYVLRKGGGWRDEDALYQRLLIENKIKLMRKYLKDNNRVFINNLIVTLPSTTKLNNDAGDTIRKNEIDKTKAQNVNIIIPKEFNSIGIIDGQHRVFSYHEGKDQYEQHISALREKQNLLVTGIIYPDKFPNEEKPIFESKIFLEINDKQSRVKGDLKQVIESIVHPYEAIAISRRIIDELGNKGPLANILELHFFDVGKVKTSSIVSYGLKHIVKLKGNDSFYHSWNNADKFHLSDAKLRTKKLLNEYIKFCTTEINKVFTAYKIHLTKQNLYLLDQKVSRGLSSTAINGLIFCIRHLIENDKLGSLEYYNQAFQKLDIDFSKTGFNYTSSHWKRLGDDIYRKCFNDHK